MRLLNVGPRPKRVSIEHHKNHQIRFYDSGRDRAIAVTKLRRAGWTYIFDYIDRQGPALSISKPCNCGCMLRRKAE